MEFIGAAGLVSWNEEMLSCQEATEGGGAADGVIPSLVGEKWSPG
jgi:hypothetical protein